MKRLVLSLVVAALSFGASSDPGARVLLDAHNCYPYQGQWADRIDRALTTGIPVAIEQDLYWYQDPATGKAWSVVSHDKPVTGTRLVRNYQGVDHTVTVKADGYEWEGRPYKSLSAIARAITGTRWNGWTFFGLQSRRGAARPGKRNPPLRRHRP